MFQILNNCLIFQKKKKKHRHRDRDRDREENRRNLIRNSGLRSHLRGDKLGQQAPPVAVAAVVAATVKTEFY